MDREHRTVHRQWRNDRVDTRTVGQARIHHGRRLVDTPTYPRDDLVDDSQQVPVILELHRCQMELAGPLDKDLIGAIDQDIGDADILQQWLQRPKPQNLIQDIVDQTRLLGQVKGLVFLQQQFAHNLANLAAKDFRRHLVDDRKIDHVQQLAVQQHLQLGMDRPQARLDLGVEGVVGFHDRRIRRHCFKRLEIRFLRGLFR